MAILELTDFRNSMKAGQAIICFDVGTSKIGVAVSDRSHLLASPYKIVKVKTRAQVFRDLENIINEVSTNYILIGLPLLSNGEEGDACIMVRNFGKDLLKLNKDLVISFYDERYSTAIAQDELRDLGIKRKRRDSRDDMVAAAIILKHFLESN